MIVNVLLPLFALLVVTAVSVEVPLVTIEVVLSEGVRPVFAPLTVSPTVPVNPFTGAIVTVKVTLPPRLTDCEAGETLTVKLGGAGWLMTRFAVMLCTSEPLVPIMVKG